MSLKFVALVALIGAAHAGVIPVPQIYEAPVEHSQVVKAPVVYSTAPATVVKSAIPLNYAHGPVAGNGHHVLAKHEEDYDPHPQYKFGYDVNDAVSGDSKSQVEERDGDVVRGEYSLIEADGFKRTVQYTADPINGFNAVVNRVPLEHHVKTLVKAPVAHYTAPATIIKEYNPSAAYHQHH